MVQPSSSPCVCCEYPRLEPTGWRGQASGLPFGISRCPSCGVMSTDPLPGIDQVNRYYAEEFSYGWYRLYSRAKRRDAVERASELAPVLGNRVLDLGGGLGYLSEVLRGRGFDATVYDPYADASVARPTEGTFDSVVSLHVLEHTRDPLAFLEDAARFLKPGGHIVLAVPNAGGEGYARLGMTWEWAQPPVLHIHHFTSDGLARLLERAGFADVDVSFHERWDANSESDLRSRVWPRLIRRLKSVPVLRRYGTWQRGVARLDIARRFSQLETARRRSSEGPVRAEILVKAALTRDPT